LKLRVYPRHGSARWVSPVEPWSATACTPGESAPPQASGLEAWKFRFADALRTFFSEL
jgi:hypothetical protein